jgi:hypothetical protein
MLGDVVTDLRIDRFAAPRPAMPPVTEPNAALQPRRSGPPIAPTAAPAKRSRGCAGAVARLWSCSLSLGSGLITSAAPSPRGRRPPRRWRARSHPDRTRNRDADGGPTERAGAAADAGADLMLFRPAAGRGIDLFGDFLADEAASDGADAARPQPCRRDRRARQSLRPQRHRRRRLTGADRVRTRLDR